MGSVYAAEEATKAEAEETEAPANDWRAMMQAFMDSIEGDYEYEESNIEFEIVDISYSERASQEYPSVTFHVVEGGGHGFFGDPMLDTINKSVAFVKEEVEK
ncbi:MAG: hypothetical protein SO016_06170 [Lachnospiraceae bacterium]|nr:hypothetical protein [Robinsoniella sp.]MDY3766271.1 hypothetical protein [Lachnospiraceae bacterium]